MPADRASQLNPIFVTPAKSTGQPRSSAAAYLCGSAGEVTDIEQSLLRCNHSTAYVQSVLAKAAEYGLRAGIELPSPVDGMFCPVAGDLSFTDDWGDPRSGVRRHQGTDLFADHGTPLLAIEAGVIESGTDTYQGLGGITLWLRGESGDLYYRPQRQQRRAGRCPRQRRPSHRLRRRHRQRPRWGATPASSAAPHRRRTQQPVCFLDNALPVLTHGMTDES